MILNIGRSKNVQGLVLPSHALASQFALVQKIFSELYLRKALFLPLDAVTMYYHTYEYATTIPIDKIDKVSLSFSRLMSKHSSD